MNAIKNKIIDDTVSYVSKATYGFSDTEELLDKIVLRHSILKTISECKIYENKSVSLSTDSYVCLTEEEYCELLSKIKTIC
jgi:hypothetical protein